MWLLIVVCLSTVQAVPVNQTQSAAPSGNTTDGVEYTTVGPTDAPAVAAVSVNISHNATGPAEGQNVSMELEPQEVDSAETFQEQDDAMAVQEGDILVSEDRNAVFNLWPEAVVYYEITEEVADRRSEIQAAMDMISGATCIQFKERTTEMNYLIIMAGLGCASYVGCQGGGQPLFFASKCTMGNLCHELIHALGLHHEHTRLDRNDFVDILWENIKPGKENNFKVKEGNTQNLWYDTESIMHYGRFYFSKNGLPTLKSKGSGGKMGQRSYLSQLDKERLNKLYRCGEAESTSPTHSPPAPPSTL